jgi:photosystem II stability/assembly factor-like uncharacterized protein
MKAFLVILLVSVTVGGILYNLPAALDHSPGQADAAGGAVRGEKVIAMESILYISTDGGRTFHSAALEYDGGAISVRAFARAAAGRLYAATDFGLAISDDGGEMWSFIADDAGILSAPTEIFSLALDPAADGTAYVSVVKDGIAYVYHTKDDFKTLTPVYESAERITATDMELRGAALYLGMNNGEVVLFDATDGTFRSRGNVPAPVFDIAVKHDGTVYAVTESKGVYLARNGASTWVRIGEADLRAVSPSLVVADVSSNSERAGELLLATSQGIFRTKNFGAAWEAINTVAPQVSPVASVVTRDPWIYAGKAGTLYASDDDGASWTINSLLEDGRTISTIGVFDSGERVLLGTTGQRQKTGSSFPSFFGAPQFKLPGS